jgi:hypothetical protein
MIGGGPDLVDSGWTGAFSPGRIEPSALRPNYAFISYPGVLRRVLDFP